MKKLVFMAICKYCLKYFQDSNSLQGRMIVGNVLIFITLLPVYVLIYQVRNYLKSKPFGLQTVLDSLAKDSMITLGFRLLSNWILVINVTIEIVPEYNYYIVMSIWKLNLFLGISLVVQCGIFSVIR